MYYNEVRGYLARGCELCLLGAKSVVFITGLCPLDCFYCPVGTDRFGKDVMYVNDVPVDSLEKVPQIIAEYASDGVAITGGDPAVVSHRVKQLAELLKNEFGENFHIHIYTHILNLNSERVSLLASSPIDEIRIHAISKSQVTGREKYFRLLAATGKAVGLEIPALPGFEEQLIKTIKAVENYISFVNINELDVSESNIDRLRQLGYKTNGLNINRSLETARKIASAISTSVHICSGRSKDLIQIGSRIYRHAMTTAKPNEYVQDDGTVLYDESGHHPKSTKSTKLRIRLRIGGRDLEVY